MEIRPIALRTLDGRSIVEGVLNVQEEYGPEHGPYIWVRSWGSPCLAARVTIEHVAEVTGLDVRLIPAHLVAIHHPSGVTWTRWPERIYWRGRPTHELNAAAS